MGRPHAPLRSLGGAERGRSCAAGRTAAHRETHAVPTNADWRLLSRRRVSDLAYSLSRLWWAASVAATFAPVPPGLDCHDALAVSRPSAADSVRAPGRIR